MISSLSSPNHQQASLSAIGGIVVSVFLVFMIQVLSAVQSIQSDRGPMVTLNLLELKQPRLLTKPIKETQKTKPKPARPKKIEQPITKTESASPDVNHSPTEPETESSVAENEASLPTPVPYFKLSALPQFIHRETPAYPEDMRTQGQMGIVELAVLVDRNGTVRQISILKSAGDSFDQAAIEAIQASTFLPAKIDGKAVPAILKMPVKFKLL